MFKDIQIVMYMAEPQVFIDEYEPSLRSGTYCWVSSDTLTYSKSQHNIFNDICFEDLIESMVVELTTVNLIKDK